MELHSFNGDLYFFFLPHLLLPLKIFLLGHLYIILALWLGSEISADWRESIKRAEWLIYRVLWLATPFLWWFLHLVFTNLKFFCFVSHWHARFLAQGGCSSSTWNDIFYTAASILLLERIQTMVLHPDDGSFFLLRKKPYDVGIQNDVRKIHTYILYNYFLHPFSFRYIHFLWKLGRLFPHIAGIMGDFFHMLTGLAGNVFYIVPLKIFVRYEGAFFQSFAGFSGIFFKVFARFKAGWSLAFPITTKTSIYLLYIWWSAHFHRKSRLSSKETKDWFTLSSNHFIAYIICYPFSKALQLSPTIICYTSPKLVRFVNTARINFPITTTNQSFDVVNDDVASSSSRNRGNSRIKSRNVDEFGSVFFESSCSRSPVLLASPSKLSCKFSNGSNSRIDSCDVEEYAHMDESSSMSSFATSATTKPTTFCLGVSFFSSDPKDNQLSCGCNNLNVTSQADLMCFDAAVRQLWSFSLEGGVPDTYDKFIMRNSDVPTGLLDL